MSTLCKLLNYELIIPSNMTSEKEKRVTIIGNRRPGSILELLLSLFYGKNYLLRCLTYFAWYEHEHGRVDDIPIGISLVKSVGHRSRPLDFMVVGPNGFVYTGCQGDMVWGWNKTKAFKCFYNGYVAAAVASSEGHIILVYNDPEGNGTIRVWKRDDKLGKPPSYSQVATLPTQVGRVIDKLYRINKYLWSYNRYEYPITCLCLSEDNMFLYAASFDSGSMDHTVKVWRLRDWRLVETIQGSKDFSDNTGKVNAITTGLGDLMFYASNQSDNRGTKYHATVRMFQRKEGRRKDIPKHKFICVLLSEWLAVRALFFNSTKDGTGQLYAGMADGTLRFWHQGTGWKNPVTLSYHKKAVTCIAGLSTSLVFSSSLDGQICAWGTEQYNDKPLTVLTPHQGPVYRLAVREDWKEDDYAEDWEENDDGPNRLILYSSGHDGTIKIWRISPEDIITNAQHI